MSNPDQPPSEQSPGADPKSKRNSGLFAFFKWFKPGSRESIESTSRSSSLDSLSSNKSAGTVASFSFVSPSAYEKRVLAEKCVQIGPETDTYKARLKQRDKRRESDKNVTLRKKYNLFFNRDSLLKPKKLIEDDENSKSLPLMTRAHIMEIEPEKVHRRTNSESSKVKRAGAYVHVKGKRRAPQPPGGHNLPIDVSSTASLKKKKRTAPIPPPKVEITENFEEKDEIKDVLANDYLKLDNGVLKPVKEENRPKTPQENVPTANFNALSPSSSRTSFVEAPVSPRPWYKRNSGSKEVLTKKENKYEPIERLPEVQYVRNSTLDLTLEDSTNTEKERKKEDKRKSGMSFLTNISELDREASEIIKNKNEKNGGTPITSPNEIPEFMKLKENKTNSNDTLVSPKRRSARDLIAKFNAITNVTKVTVFGASQKDKYFGKQTSLDEAKQRQEQLLESHKKRIEEIDKKKEDRFAPLMKSESASAVKLTSKPETPKMDRKSWKCPKCNLENEYWRIICHVCSTIKPYFDDFIISSKSNGDKASESESPNPVTSNKKPLGGGEKLFERSKTQLDFFGSSNYNANNKKKLENNKTNYDNKVDETSKKEEREKLKQMLIEMKNSLPKRKSKILMKPNSRTSIIMEKPEENQKEINEIKEENEEATEEQKTKQDSASSKVEKTREEKAIEILIGSTQTIYENIKVKKTDNPKPIKVSSETQTSAVVKKLVPESSIKKLIENHKANNIYEPMKAKDFEDIYSDKNGKSPAKLYANLAQNDELSLFFNVPKNITNLKNNLGGKDGGSAAASSQINNVHTDTIEINRLLRRLESAIAKGDMAEAAIFAKELAQLKVNCSVVRQRPHGMDVGKKKGYQIEMYVEDKVSHRGPFPIDVTNNQTVAELKAQIFREFEIPVDVQRWILGKALVADDASTLKDHNITEGCPVFLYLVAPEKKPSEEQNMKQKPTDKPSTSKVENPTSIGENNTKRTSVNLTDTQIPLTVTQINNAEKDDNTDKCEKNEKKKEEKVTSKEVEKKEDKVTTDAPKVINVIPKITEKSNNKIELVKLLPVQKELSPKPSQEISANPKSAERKSSVTTQIPVSVTEIKVDVRSSVSKAPELRSKEERTGLVRAKVSKVEVLQAPSINVQNIKPQEVMNKTSNAENKTADKIKTESSKSVETKGSELPKMSTRSQEVKITVASSIPVISTKLSVQSSSSSTKLSSASSNPLMSTTEVKSTSNTSNIYPNLSKLTSEVTTVSTTNMIKAKTESEQSKSQRKEPPKAEEEKDFEEYDSNTLKPLKEWECHLCTLLNPMSSNICAVCATVRLKKATLRKSNKKKPAPQPQDQTYLQLVNLDNADLVPNADAFECVVCFLDVGSKEGVTLRECLHQFCRDCLARTVEFAEDAEIKCPYRDDDYSCNIALQDREVKALVSPAIYEQHLAKSVAQAENKMEKTFHCKTPDCKGWCIFEDNVNEFKCPVCRRTNCLTCQAIHIGLNCKQYQERMQNESGIDEDAKRTKDFLKEMVEKGEAIECPTCKVILMKKWGCDWLRCSMCKTEICWVTRGPRWGPAGKGDTTGGCQCGVNGIKCHPKCNYCH